MSAPADTFAIWRAAEQPTIDVERLPWPQLERLTRAASMLRPSVETSSIAADVLHGVAAARRILTCTPLPPDHPLVGLTELVTRITVFAAEHPGHTLLHLLEPLAERATQLAATASPVAAWLTDVLTQYGAGPDGTPEALLVVPRRAWVLAVWGWLHQEELTCVDVATPAELRTGVGAHRVAMLAGHPAVAFSSAFKGPEVAVREHGWLLTAPPADRVRLALPADAPRLPEDRLWLLPAPAHPALNVTDSGPQRSDPAPAGPTDEAPIEWQMPERPANRPVPRPAVAGDEAATAIELHLASGHAVFFHPEVGPRPHVIAVDDTGAVALTTAPLVAVTAGTVLAIRVGAVAHDRVTTFADEWLRARRGWDDERIAEVRDCAQQLKTALRRALQVRGHELLLRELRHRLPEGYARTLLHNPLDEYYIAPQRRGFDALIDAIGARTLRTRFDDLAAVRVAHQRAGEQIRREILELLADRSWVEDLDETGWTALHAGPLGTLLVAVVTGRLERPVPVPRTWLGVPVDSAGRRVLALSATHHSPLAAAPQAADDEERP